MLTTDCKDGAYQADATCGWFKDASGGRIPDSQGFCCPCDAQSSWQQSVFGGATDRSRGNVNCNLFQSNLFLNGLPASASCMRYSELWYAAYSVSSASYEFQLTLTLTPSANGTAAGGGGGGAPEVLTLSPVTLVALNGAQTVAAELLGDLGGFQEMPVLSQKLLFIPRPANGSAGAGDPARWPLLDASAVSLDGSGCDKPGVMFSGFRNQPNKCGVPAGSCLGNQLQDIVDADDAAAATGATPRHNLGALGVGAPRMRDALPGAAAPDKKRLALPATQLRNSIVVLTLNADAIRFVVNFSPGRILSAELVDFTGRAAAGFTALSGNGRLAATVVNNGTIDASYYLSVVNCSAGVSLIPSPGALALAAGAVLTQQWACAVEDDTAAQRNCTVVLQDARFVVVDTRLVRFYTNATVYDAIPQLDGRGAGTGVGAPQGGGGSCAATCPNLLNLWCAAVHFCWARLAQGLAIIGALLAFAYWTLVRCGPCKLAAALLRHAPGGGSGAKPPATAPPQQQPAWGAPAPRHQREAHVLDIGAGASPAGAAGQQRAARGEAEQLALELAAMDALLMSGDGRGGGGGSSSSGRKGRSPRRWSGGAPKTRASALLAEYTRAEARRREGDGRDGRSAGRAARDARR